jgi:lipopolysaccharide biosynthesis regulator YciM
VRFYKWEGEKMAIKSTKEAKLINGLFDLYCHDCGRHLAAVPRSTWTLCPDCRRWSRVEPEEILND